MSEVEDFYLANYERLVSYVANKKRGGDHVTLLTASDARAVVHETFIYHLTNKSKFIPGFVWNKLIQMRKNYYRDMMGFNNFRNELKQIEEDVPPNEYDDVVGQLIWWEDRHLIEEEIAMVKNEERRSILTNHFLNSEPLPPELRKRKNVINRFKVKLIKKHGVGNEDNMDS